MKKTILIISIFTFFISSAISQSAWEVQVNWEEACDCLGYDEDNYFKVTISIYDDANNVLVDSDLTETAGGTESDVDIPTVNVDSYCSQIHTNTPSFTIRATVWFIETSTNPETVCCSNSDADIGVTCADIAGGHEFFPEISLN